MLKDVKVQVEVMSGADDGMIIECSSALGDGEISGDSWVISIGRMDFNTIRLGSDTLISRQHASLIYRDQRWWLEDKDSRNGSFVTSPESFFTETPVKGVTPIDIDTWFRIGRTWLCLVSYSD